MFHDVLLTLNEVVEQLFLNESLSIFRIYSTGCGHCFSNLYSDLVSTVLNSLADPVHLYCSNGIDFLFFKKTNLVNVHPLTIETVQHSLVDRLLHVRICGQYGPNLSSFLFSINRIW